MTQPFTPGPFAFSDNAHAVTHTMINNVLTTMVSELQAGADNRRVTDLVGGELTGPHVTPTHMRLLAACALSRLARLHHAIEQLADVHDANGMPNAAAELRKLVDP